MPIFCKGRGDYPGPLPPKWEVTGLGGLYHDINELFIRLAY